MTKPFSRLCSIPQRHLLPLTLLTCTLTTGCQTPGFATALSGKKPAAQTVASTAATESKQAGLPEPTNTATSNSPLSLSSIDEHLRLGEQELARGNHQQAKLHFEHVLEKHPDHAKAHHRLGVLADKLSRFEQAEQHYLTALAGDSRNAALLSDLGYSYFMQGRHADAERYLLESRKVNPQYDTAIANLGLLYGSTGRKQEALALFRQIGDDSQVQAIMQQIDGGEFGPAGKLASNSPGAQQSSVFTTQTSVQQSASGNSRGLHHDPTRDFAEQLQKAREELRRAEEEFARHQQAQNGQLAQVAGQQQTQQDAWTQQTPSSQQQTQPSTWQNEQMSAQQTQPNGDAAHFNAVGNVEQSSHPAGMQNAAHGFGPQNVVGPLPEVTPGARFRSESASSTTGGSQHPLSAQSSASAQTGDRHNQHAGPFASQQHTADDSRHQPQQATPGQSPWDQGSSHSGGAANAGATSPQNSFTAGQNSRPVAASAWGQQFATSVEQSGAQGTSNTPQSIQQLSGNAHSPGQQQPVEHAHHTQSHQQNSQNNITLAGQERPASAGPMPQIGTPSPDSWSNGGQGSHSATASQSNSYDAARREAALLGLNAGPGQVFPYIQRYERARTDASPQHQGAQQYHGGQTSSGNVYGIGSSGQPSGGSVHGVTSTHAAAAASQPAQQWSPQQNVSQQDSLQQPQQQWHSQQHQQPQQQWLQQSTTANQDRDAAQPSRQANDQYTQAWGQQPPSAPYGVSPSTTTQHYGPTPTPQSSQPSHVTPAPYYERPSAGGQSVGVSTGYESPQPPTSDAPQQASGGVVVPEAYHQRQPAPAGNYQQPPAQQHQQQFQHQQQHRPPPQVQSNPRPYTGPMIVPGDR
jgi:Flp pilus assembly protein TadD